MYNIFLLTSSTDYLITLNLKDLAKALFWLIGCVILIVIGMILYKVYQSVKDFREVIKRNSDNIDKVLKELPGISSSVNSISSDVEKATKAFMPSVDNVAQISNDVTENIKKNNPLNEFITSIYTVIKNFRNLVNSVMPDKETYYEIKEVDMDKN